MGILWGAPGFPSRRPLIREGVNSGQIKNAGDNILGQEWIGRARGLAEPGEGNATCSRSVMSGVGLGELSGLLGSVLLT